MEKEEGRKKKKEREKKKKEKNGAPRHKVLNLISK